MNISSHFSQVLLVNLFLIKIVIFHILMHEAYEKRILEIAYKRHKIHKKLLILATEKLKVCCLFMYYSINKITTSTFKKGNYKSLQKRLKVQPLDPLICEYGQDGEEMERDEEEINLILNTDGMYSFMDIIESFDDAYSSEISKKVFKFGKLIQKSLKDYAREKL